jgi:iron complex transport system substrate-binding protein
MPSDAIDRAVRETVETEGSVYEIDVELLLELGPHLILTQAVCDVCAVPTDEARKAVESAGLDAETLSLDAHSLRDILESMRLVGQATETEGRAEVQVAELRRRMHDVSRAVTGASRPRVLALEWLDPLFTPGHWVPEMIDMAGGECLAGAAKERSEEVSAEQLVGLDADVLLIMPCGYGLSASRRDATEHANLLRSIAPRAIEEGRAFVVNGSSYFNRSGPRVVDGVEVLAGLLHPELWGLPLAGAAATWKPTA